MKFLFRILVILPLVTQAQRMPLPENSEGELYKAKLYEDVKLLQQKVDSLVSNTDTRMNLKKFIKDFNLKGSDSLTLQPEEIFNYGKNIVASGKILSNLFDPSAGHCSLPKRVLHKLQKDGNWIPNSLQAELQKMPDSLIAINGVGLTPLLNYIEVVHKDKSKKPVLVAGSPTFRTLDYENYITPGFNTFAYSLDCSGYLNDEIQLSGVVPGNDITAAAKASLDNKYSMFVGKGIVISPLYAAYVGSASGIQLDTANRILILEAIENLPDIHPSDSIIINMSYEVLWTSDNGSSSLNGDANFGGKSSLGLGVINFASSGSASTSISREVSFSSFDVYLTSRILNEPIETNLESINKLLARLKGN
jgi:hypothetical protein